MSEAGDLRAALVKVRAHTSYVNPSVELLGGLLESIARIADAALAGEQPEYAEITRRRAQIEEVVEARRQRDEFHAVIIEADALLDAAGVPDARGVACDDPKCNTRLGHRIHQLRRERDRARQLHDATCFALSEPPK